MTSHLLHSICPYFAMFPPEFVEHYTLAFSNPGDIVLDPFCGRGTTVFESVLLNRNAYGLDISPVAYCITSAKANPPNLLAVLTRLDLLRNEFETSTDVCVPRSEFFHWCYAERTLRQICFLRRSVDWRQDVVDRFITALVLNCLHGESHKTENCFSNRMPRTISTKPMYSVRWWKERDLYPPERDVFEILARQAAFRLSGSVPRMSGQVRLGDARDIVKVFPELIRAVQLVVTSPPYFDTTDYGEDQWLRMWFLGGGEYPKARLFRDSRYENVSEYWNFIRETFSQIGKLLTGDAVVVVRIGGKAFDDEVLADGLRNALDCALPDFYVGEATESRSSDIRRRQTNVFRPGTSGRRREVDFVFKVVRDLR